MDSPSCIMVREHIFTCLLLSMETQGIHNLDFTINNYVEERDNVRGFRNKPREGQQLVDNVRCLLIHFIELSLTRRMHR
jgi:hypothetical protein